MTATDHAGTPEGIAQESRRRSPSTRPSGRKAAIRPSSASPTFVVGSVMLGLALINYARAAGGALPSGHNLTGAPIS